MNHNVRAIMLYRPPQGFLVKTAYGEEGHEVLQNRFNQAAGAKPDSGFSKMLHQGNKMTDAASGTRVGKAVDNALLGPFNPANADFHSFVEGPGAAPTQGTRDLIKTRKAQARTHLARSGELLHQSEQRGSGLMGRMGGWLDKKRAGYHTARAGLNQGMAQHIQQDWVSHGQRVQNVLPQVVKPITQAESWGDVARTVGKAVTDKAAPLIPSSIRRSAQAGIAHSTPESLAYIDSPGGIGNRELRVAANQGKKLRSGAATVLGQQLGNPAQAEHLIEQAMQAPVGRGTELLAKTVHRGSVAKARASDAATRLLSILRKIRGK